MLRTDWVLRGPLDERGFPVRSMSDMSWLAPILIIGAGAGIVADHSNRLGLLAGAHVLRSYRRYSSLRNPGWALGGYAISRIALRLDLNGAERFAQATEYWAERADHLQGQIRIQFIHNLLLSWLRPRRSIIEPLQRIAQTASELGDIEFTRYALHESVTCAALSGEPLPLVARRIDSLRKLEPSPARRILSEGYGRVYALLLRETREPIDWQVEAAAIDVSAKGYASADVLIHVHWIAMLCLFGQYELAGTYAERLWPRIRSRGHFGSRIADYTMYRGLCQAVEAEKASGILERRRSLYTLGTCLWRLRRWSRLGPDFIHMTKLLQAETASARGHATAALRHYHEGAECAYKAGYMHHAALCHERRAGLLARQRRDTESEAAVSTAIALYEEWGALAKVRQLQSQR
jgi:hypothetical protein